MPKHTIAFIASLLTGASGCASSTASPAMRMTMPTEQLVAEGAPTASGVQLVAMPIQLGQWIGPGTATHGMAPVALRLPVGVPTDQWFVSPTVEPKLVGTDDTPAFDARAIPMLPFGSFWIEISNQGTQPLTIEPKKFGLELGGKRRKALDDSGAISGRWALTLQTIGIRAFPQAKNAFLTLPLLDKRVEIAPAAKWKGYVVFDTGAYSPDEYNELLRKSPAAKLELDTGSGVVSVDFKTASRDLPAVCLPGTKAATFGNCELLVEAR